ncbi:hypothetical protein AAHI06_13445 [Pseudomonas salmasensis]|uniref:Uncharacterized protein n=1 Tax=Pseudomonas salmasensis TaxID=2745514 RepID=A0ABU5FN84_9PSED|nr:hypothetical protein [Pseudomonas salmasensis]MDY4301749.1 hypothetical protein [Pseudomonas salmasensis]QXH78439.1 hypothetical protein HU731_001065 [Pseudomonas salmasensis]
MPVPATPEEIEWTPYGYKHCPSAQVPWRTVIASTLIGPAKYRPGIAIEKLEREAYKNGTPTTNGKPWKVMEFSHCIGASHGKLSRWVRIELSAGAIHGHPISEQEFRRLTN